MDEIERIPEPTPEEFASRFVRTSTPVILTDMTRDWPARRLWSLDYFAERFGQRTVIAGRTRSGRLEMHDRGGIPQVEIPFARYVEMLRDGDPDCYLISPVDERLPELLDDIRCPELCRRASWRSTRLWIGGGTTLSPLHRDWPQNLYVQVLGSKRITLVHRRERRRVYRRPFYSGVPNFTYLDDAEDPDLSRFPLFRDVPRVRVDVRPGETLYIPRLWWHQVRALEESVSINLWFADGGVALVARALQTYARVRGLRT